MHLTRLAVFAILLAAPAFAVAQEIPAPPAEMKLLQREVGVWNAKMTVTIPGQDPMTDEGVETNRMLGGRWLVTNYRGNFAGEKFQGLGQIGYDEKKKKFVGTWIDSMAPYMSKMEGTYDKEKDTMTMMSTGVNLDTGEPQMSKLVTVYQGKDARTMTMYMDVGDGKMVETAKIVYTRKARPRRGADKKTDSAK